MGTDKGYQELFAELTRYENSGIRMQIDGMPASPMQIVSAHMLREDSGYMRDYIMDEKGVVEELDFYRVGRREDSEE
ncbi:hypothetical protein ABXS75_01190 [Roseburia hominis]